MDEEINPMQQASNSLKLHLGCGANKIPGWINIDAVKSCKPDLVHDITRPLSYGDATVDEILAEDLLEHFDKYMRFVVFSDWARVLKIGGKITLQVPNFKKILFRYFKFGFDNFVDFIFGENMLRSEVYTSHYGNHKWGYSEQTLKEFVCIFGIEPVEVKKECLNLRLVGRKTRHVAINELDKVMIYSQANKSGIGEEYMPFSSVREKIEVFNTGGE